MSAAAIHLLDHLRENGVEDDRAVKIAEAFDRRVDEVLAESKAHSDRNRAESEEKAKVQFVPAADYHARDKTLATREDVGEVRKEIAETNRRVDNLRDTLLAEISAYRAETRAEIAEVRAEVRGIHRLLFGGFLTLAAGVVTVIAKLFFGV